MLARAHSSVTYGVEIISVSVEIDVTAGLPGFSIVGLPGRAVRESVVRVRSALRNSGFRFPRRKVTVNLAPGGIPKEGPVFDLPIALGILVASGQLEQEVLQRKMIVGELSLNGSVCAVRGVLPRIIDLAKMRDWSCVIPRANALEAHSIEGVSMLAVSSLTEAITGLKEPKGPTRIVPQVRSRRQASRAIDFAHVRGQMQAKRGLLVAAAGGHNALLIGPPGVGKTMLARCLPGVINILTYEEALETSQIHSIAGLLKSNMGLLEERPFRAPHHTASTTALVGGGAGVPHPGEVSLAHNGVLFLDELPEFRRDALEVLRQPLEDGEVMISRSRGNFMFPSRFMLVAAMNPCPCGYYGTERGCVCTDVAIRRYRGCVSGPLLDRIDIHLYVPPMKVDEMSAGPTGEPSRILRRTINRCRRRQAERYEDLDHGRLLNAHLSPRRIERVCRLDRAGLELIRQAVNEMGLSTRAYHRVLKVARTIADLEGLDQIGAPHIAEAIGYRLLDRDLVP